VVNSISAELSNRPTMEKDRVDPLLLRLGSYVVLGAEESEALSRAVRRSPAVQPYEEILGDGSRDVCVLQSGLACQFKLLGNGRRQITGLLVPGDILDFGFLTGTGPQGHFMTLCRSDIGRISIQNFTALCDQHPRIMQAVLRASAVHGAIAQERVLSLGLRTALERVAHILCEMYHRLDAVGLVTGGATYDFRITQAEMGEALGLSTVHINRTLQALRRSGYITMRNGKVTIENMNGLCSEGNFDPAYLANITAGSQARPN
jgi:CRP-like cAMP-binding protein